MHPRLYRSILRSRAGAFAKPHGPAARFARTLIIAAIALLLGMLAGLAACAGPSSSPIAPRPDAGADAGNAPDAPPDASPRTLRIGAAGSPAELAAWDFGDQRVGSASPGLALTVENATDQVSAAIVVTIGAAFPLDPSSTCAANIQLAPGATCSILVRFLPTDLGPTANALTVDAGPEVGAAALALSGTGVAGPDLDTDPPFVDFATVEFGTVAERTLALVNEGPDVTLGAITVGQPIGAGMSLASTTCTGQLAAGARCDLVVQFRPSAFGQSSGSLTVDTNRGPYTIGANWLMGYGGARLVVEKAGIGDVTSDGGGNPNVDCGATCAGLFSNGPDHHLTETTPGTFLGWGGDGAGCGAADTCAIALSTTGPTTVQASFTP